MTSAIYENDSSKGQAPPDSHRIPTSIKFAYGFGQIGEQVKTRGFDLFVFFYFNQILGLEGWMCGLAVAIALGFDAITDPLAGSLSDNWQSLNGRRHPFMYASALPLGIFWVLLFFPPSSLNSWGLFAWLVTFAVLVRGAMTLYHVPHLALGAEMTENYEERTSIVSYRVIFGVMGGVGTTVIGLRFFFPETEEFANSMLNPAGYPKVALFGAAVMVTTIWYSAWGTRAIIPHLPKAPANPEAFSMKRVLTEFQAAWKNPSFRALFVGFSLFGLSYGVTNTLAVHINVFFWEFGSKEIVLLSAIFIPGFLLGAVFARAAHRRFDKKQTLIAAAVLSTIAGNAPVSLRLLGIFPENGSPMLLPMVLSFLAIVSALGAMAIISAGSMMADVAQEFAFESGSENQGIFFSATSFSGKLASGGGHLLAGLGISLIEFPTQATDPGAVAPEVIRNLALVSLTAALLSFVSIYFYTRYRITRERYQEILGLSGTSVPSETI